MSESIEKLPSFGFINGRLGLFRDAGSKQHEYHASGIIAAAREFFEEILIIDPWQAVIEITDPKQPPKVFYGEQDISSLSTLMVRATHGVEAPVRALATALSQNGCHLVDPLARYSGARASKAHSGLHRQADGAGLCTSIAFLQDRAEWLVRDLWQKKMFPLIAKPIYGKQGFGIEVLDSLDEALAHVAKHFTAKPDDALLVQKFVDFKREFRVLLVHGHCLGAVEKQLPEGSRIANAAQGARFVVVDDLDLIRYVLSNVPPRGLIGVDIATDAGGNYYIIEENRAPNWREIEKVLGIDVAREVIVRVYLKTRMEEQRRQQSVRQSY